MVSDDGGWVVGWLVGGGRAEELAGLRNEMVVCSVANRYARKPSLDGAVLLPPPSLTQLRQLLVLIPKGELLAQTCSGWACTRAYGGWSSLHAICGLAGPPGVFAPTSTAPTCTSLTGGGGLLLSLSPQQAGNQVLLFQELRHFKPVMTNNNNTGCNVKAEEEEGK